MMAEHLRLVKLEGFNNSRRNHIITTTKAGKLCFVERPREIAAHHLHVIAALRQSLSCSVAHSRYALPQQATATNIS